MVETRALERAKSFFFRHFEQIFVLLLVASLLGIHYLVEQKLAFLSFYYLATILAGSYGGRRLAVMSGVFIVVLVFFFQAIVGLDMLPGFYEDALLTLVPWASTHMTASMHGRARITFHAIAFSLTLLGNFPWAVASHSWPRLLAW